MDCHSILSSSEGFLFTLEDSTQEIHAIDPLTGSHLLLPSIASFPNWTATLRNFTTDRITHYVEDDDEPKIKLYLYQDKVNGMGMGKGSSFLFQRIDPTTAIDVADLYRQDYYRKAILSPSLDYVVVIYGLDPDEQKLAIGQTTTTTTPSSWTPLHHKSSRFFVDIIFHQGRLHALDSDCALTIFDSIQNPLAPSLFCPPAVNPIPLKGNEKKVDRRMEMYLVESPNGHDLFLVYRIFKPVEADLQPVTKTFKVYKLDKSNECCYKWEPVETIGDLAFFVGYNHSISLSSRDFPPNLLKPNSIYFTDTYFFNYRIGDNGVFHLENGTLHFYQINDAIHKLYKMQPIWLMPRSACSF